MIVGIGVDVVELSRMRRLLSRYGSSLLDRLLTTPEKETLSATDAHLDKFFHITFVAGRFAAKEAFTKALGTGFSNGIACRDISVLSHPTGAPYIVCTGMARVCLEEMDTPTVHVSISHGRETAIAMVVLECH